MPGIEVITKDGTTTVTTKPVEIKFPAPTGEFSSLSNMDLAKKAKATASELRQFQGEFDEDYKRRGQPDDQKASALKYYTLFRERFSETDFSLASEMLSRIDDKLHGSEMPQVAVMGASLVVNKVFAGPRAGDASAAFLEILADKLPKK